MVCNGNEFAKSNVIPKFCGIVSSLLPQSPTSKECSMRKSKDPSRVCSKWAALCLSVICLLLPVVILAQSDNAQISGFVKDPQGSSVPNASVTIKNESSNFDRQ